MYKGRWVVSTRRHGRLVPSFLSVTDVWTALSLCLSPVVFCVSHPMCQLLFAHYVLPRTCVVLLLEWKNPWRDVRRTCMGESRLRVWLTLVCDFVEAACNIEAPGCNCGWRACVHMAWTETTVGKLSSALLLWAVCTVVSAVWQ